MGSPLVLAGVASTGTVGALCLHYPPLAPQKNPEQTMADYKNIGLHPVGAPHAYEKQARKLNKEDAMDRCKWRKMIKEAR